MKNQIYCDKPLINSSAGSVKNLNYYEKNRNQISTLAEDQGT